MRSRDDTNTSIQGDGPFAVHRRDLDRRRSVVSVRGELDLSTAPQLKWALTDAREDGHDRLIVDLSRTAFMDSTALGVLVGVNRSLGAGGRLTIVCAKASLLRVFELSGMDGVFTLVATLEDALGDVSPPAVEAG